MAKTRYRFKNGKTKIFTKVQHGEELAHKIAEDFLGKNTLFIGQIQR